MIARLRIRRFKGLREYVSLACRGGRGAQRGGDARNELANRLLCYSTQAGAPSIVLAPDSVMKAIAQNLGRPSDFQREGSFSDEPTQTRNRSMRTFFSTIGQSGG